MSLVIVQLGILAGSEIAEEDNEVINDKNHFGILHGDLNCGNFFYIDDCASLSVFDWDQCQQGWFLWDVAQAIFTVVMLAEAGLPISCTPVPEAKPLEFEDWIIEGYEEMKQHERIDRQRLKRMIQLRKTFYERFCRRAEEEGNIPNDMSAFIKYIVDWFDRKSN